MRLPTRRGFATTTDALRMHARARAAARSRSKGRNTETRLGEANALRRAKTGRRKEIMRDAGAPGGLRQTVEIEFPRPRRENFPAAYPGDA